MATTLSASSTTLNGRGRLPAPPRERRPALAVLALLLVVAGALASALVAYRSGDRVDVLVATREIALGEEIGPEDLGIARVAAEGGATIPAEAEQNFVGARATSRIPEDTLLNRTMFLDDDVVPPNGVVVGVVLAPTQRPAEPLAAGDVVRAFRVPRSDDAGGSGTAGSLVIDAARVVEVQAGAAGGDTVSVSLLVPQQLAPTVVPVAATGEVALARLPLGAKPRIDLRTP